MSVRFSQGMGFSLQRRTPHRIGSYPASVCPEMGHLFPSRTFPFASTSPTFMLAFVSRLSFGN